MYEKQPIQIFIQLLHRHLWVKACPGVWHNTDTCDHIELCHFLNFIGVDVSVSCPVSVCVLRSNQDLWKKFTSFAKVLEHMQSRKLNWQKVNNKRA